MARRIIRPEDGKLLLRGRIILWWQTWWRSLVGLGALVLLASLGVLLAVAAAARDDEPGPLAERSGAGDAAAVETITTPSGEVRQVVRWMTTEGENGRASARIETVIDGQTYYLPSAGETVFAMRTTTLPGGEDAAPTVLPGSTVTLPGETVTLPAETVVVTETLPSVTVVETETVTETVTVVETVIEQPPP